ncbi:MAG: amidase domain-containing protein, partial [Ruminiclostridium sp.]|nr:amidase domain-containing protein [Ruminiclostridium sp.]
TYNSLSEYFNTDNSYGKLYSGFCNTSLQYLIFARSSRSADLHYEEASFVITVEKVSVKSGVYTVNYTISEKVAFAICDTPAESCGIEVEARISKGSDGSYKFDILAEDTDVNLLIEENVMDYLGYDYEQYYLKDMTIPEGFKFDNMYSSILKNLKAEAESHILSQEEMLTEYNANPDSFALKTKAKHQYNRDKAVQYSYKWVDGEEVVRNPDYSDYSIYGGNCQNYVSQSIFASGIPMDWNGDEQWKWFDDWSDTSETATGRSGSWSGTEYFYEYCCKNTGFGMVTETDGNIYSAQPGDVIQYVVDGWAHHSVIVSKVVYDDDGNVVDLLINSNTTDRVDYPMSAYGYTDIRVIRIVGYNDK